MLLDNIQSGLIALPELQRPFVWENAKIRDLLDSMYRGYPVGTLLFWMTGGANNVKTRAYGGQATVPHWLIVDGQQRLTGLYAVIKGKPVLRNHYSEEYIRIAFNPFTGAFEVPDASIPKDPSFIPDISALWRPGTSLLQFIPAFLARYRNMRGEEALSAQMVTAAEQNIQRLTQLKETYSFTVLQLVPQLTEEEVAQVFVRVNSTGKVLKQSDFILTIMSIYWDEGRKKLEAFSRDCRLPVKQGASPFNYLFRPEPEHMLRVAVALAFRRSRLEHVYSLLRGKDMDSGEVSEERRDTQFAKLETAQAKALDLSSWFEFILCLTQAGYRRANLISSTMAVVYSFSLFLIGKHDFAVPQKELRQVISRWFFFVSLTGRYTHSPESQMEKDLADIRGLATAAEFTEHLESRMAMILTPDFWAVSLPGAMNSSAARSPELFAYFAALNLLGAKVLFSQVKVAELMDPALNPKKPLLDRHHLFPKGYLKKKTITATRDINQIANMALLEWPENIRIKDDAPSTYFPPLFQVLSPKDKLLSAELHALPGGWENMEYWDFLVARRELMAGVIKKGFEAVGG
ncbi:DUF262 domain-containing protein [Desulfovibrio sp. OttesenSCG-928-F20]|nr:DUF262 domain-containing protein [Desulfovibrio sp. OttesenSCG-928-F20]